MLKSILLLILYTGFTFSQTSDWKLIGNDNYINEIVVDGDYAWATTSSGIARVNLINEELKYFSRADYPQILNVLYAVTVDKNGNKWFGGLGSLIKYDGINFTVYNSSNSPLSPYGVILALCPDKLGNLWIGGNGVSLWKFDGTIWTHYNTGNSGLPAQYVRSLMVDSNNVLWIGTTNGIAEFNGISWRSHLPSTYIPGLAVDHSGNIWAADYYNGVLKYNGVTWDLALPIAEVRSVSIDNKENVWAGLTRYKGLAKFDGNSWFIYDSTNSNLSSRAFTKICALEDENIIVGSDSGLFLSNKEGFSRLLISNTPWVRYISSFAFDNLRKELWVGTDFGLFRYNGYFWKKYISELPSYRIKSLFIDSDARLWAATNNGIGVYDGSEWIKYQTTNSGLPHNNVLNITEDSLGTKWISTENGAALINENGWSILDTTNSPLPSNQIFQIAINGKTIWFAASGGLAKKTKDTWFIYDSTNSALNTSRIRSVAALSNGSVFAGTENAGLTLITDDSSYTYTKYNSELESNEIRSITAVNDTLLISAADGINILYSNKWRSFTSSNSPMKYGSKNAVIKDPEGYIWIGNSSGNWGADLARYKEYFDIISTENLPSPAAGFTLEQNFPNPFNPTTVLAYSIPKAGKVTIRIFDAIGRNVNTLLDNYQTAGRYEINFDGSNLASGIYFYQLISSEFSETKKMILMK